MSQLTYPSEPLEPEGLLLVLTSIDVRKWGRGRAAAVAFVGAHRGQWVELSAGSMQRWIGMSRGWGGRMMAGLVDAHVIDRLDGRGGRAHAYRVQPDLLEWRGVPWTVDPELVGHRIAMFHEEQHSAANPAAEAFLAPSRTARSDVFLAPSYTARGSRFVARSRTARERTGPSHLSRPLGAREGGERVAPSRSAREISDGPKRSSLHGGPGRADPPPLASGDEEERSITTEEATALRAVQRHARARFIAGRPRAQVLRLLDDHTPAALTAALERCPAGLGLDALVSELELELLAVPVDTHESRTPTGPPLVLVEDLDPDAPPQDWQTAAEGVRRARSAMDPLGSLPRGPEAWETPTDAGGAQ